MRSQDEIVERIKRVKAEDMFGFEWTEYLYALDLDHAKKFALPDANMSDFPGPVFTSDEIVKAMMIEYMPFAWEKANNFRGISAMRSLCHYTAWLWMLGDDVIWPTLNEYEHYGKEHLRTLCGFLGLDADRWDDGVRMDEESD